MNQVKVNADNQHVINLFNHYQKMVLTRPSFYTAGEKVVNITLPIELLDYANAAAGHSGFGAGARPVGIRKVVENSSDAMKSIFESTTTLADFINSSECDGYEYVQGLKNPELKVQKRNATRSARTVFFEKYDFSKVKELRSKYEVKTLTADFDSMRWEEFALKYDLSV